MSLEQDVLANTLSVQEVVGRLNSKFGEGSLLKAGELVLPERVETGISDLDRALGGGLPVGITVLAGEPNTGKTLTAIHAAVTEMRNQRPVLYIPVEDQSGLTYLLAAKQSIPDLDNLLLLLSRNNNVVNGHKKSYGITFGDVLKAVEAFGSAKNQHKGRLVVIDTMMGLTTGLEDISDGFEDQVRGQRQSTFITNLNLKSTRHCLTVLIITQLRLRSNGCVDWLAELPGGRALSHYAKLELRLTKTRFVNREEMMKRQNGTRSLEVVDTILVDSDGKARKSVRTGEALITGIKVDLDVSKRKVSRVKSSIPDIYIPLNFSR